MSSHASSEQLLAAVTVPIVGPVVFVAIRFVNNYGLRKRFLADDWFSVVGLVFLIVTGALYYTIHIQFKNTSTTIEDIGRMTVSLAFISSLGAYFSKIPILLLYLRLFGAVSGAWLRITVYVLLTVPFLVLSAGASYTAAMCSPDFGRTSADPAYLPGCVRAGLGICVYNMATSIAADVVIFIIPLPAIAGLRLPRGKKLGVVVVFMSGLLGITAGAVALYYRSVALATMGKQSNSVAEMLGPVVECSIAIMVGCVPALSCFWRTRVAQSALYSRFISLLSHKSDTREAGRRVKNESQTLDLSVECRNGGHQDIVGLNWNSLGYSKASTLYPKLGYKGSGETVTETVTVMQHSSEERGDGGFVVLSEKM